VQTVYSLDSLEGKKGKRCIMFDLENSSPLMYNFETKSWQASKAANAEIDQIMQDTVMEQNVQVTAMNVFMLDPQMIKVMILLIVLGTVVGIPLNSIFHMFPNTLIRWIP
jgi:hypothetical protein